MGTYIHRVTAEMVKLSDGRKAHVAKYAYKPYGGSFFRGSGDANAKMHFKSGCVASENMTLKSDLIATIDPEKGIGTLYRNAGNLKVFYDDYNYGSERLPKVADIRREGKVWNIVEKA